MELGSLNEYNKKAHTRQQQLGARGDLRAQPPRARRTQGGPNCAKPPNEAAVGSEATAARALEAMESIQTAQDEPPAPQPPPAAHLGACDYPALPSTARMPPQAALPKPPAADPPTPPPPPTRPARGRTHRVRHQPGPTRR